MDIVSVFAMMRLTSLVAFLILTTYSALAQTRRAMTPEDTLRVANVGDAQISPDGVWTVMGRALRSGLHAQLRTLPKPRLRPRVLPVAEARPQSFWPPNGTQRILAGRQTAVASPSSLGQRTRKPSTSSPWTIASRA
jgi:hypothetical protein